MAQLQFNATNVPVAVPLEPLDDGWYPAMIVESEIKPTSAGDGMRLALKLSVLPDHPHYGNRKIFDGLNIANPNPVAQGIAQEQLSAICHATNVIIFEDTNQLHGIPLLVKVITKPKRTDTITGKTYDAANEVKGYARVGTQQVNVAAPNKGLNLTGGAAPASPTWATQGAPAAPVGAVPSFVQQAAPAAAPAAVAPAVAQAAAPAPSAWQKPVATPAPAAAPAPLVAAAAAPDAVAPSWATQAQPEATAAPAAAVAPAPAQAAPAAAVPSWAQGAQ